MIRPLVFLSKKKIKMASNLKLELNYLVKDELVYEAQIRGLGEGTDLTVDQLRKVLRSAIKLEKTSFELKNPSHPFTFDEDSDAILGKVDEINELVENFVGTENDSAYKKAISKIAHSVGRINRAKATTPEQQKIKADLRLQLLLALDNIKEKVKKEMKKETLLDLSVLNKSLAEPGAHSSMVDLSESDSDGGRPVKPRKSVPVRDWGLKFTGEHGSMSFSQFLERVEDLRRPRGVSREMLFNEAIDLFEGDARKWYIFIRQWVTDWDSLVNSMREQFQSKDYDRKLFDEIKQRTQGPNESVGMYFACMNGLFNRLNTPVPDETKLQILKENVDPFYHPFLIFHDINSVSQLLQKCRKLDESRDLSRRYVPPPRRNKVLEPDLAYVGHFESSSASTSSSVKDRPVEQSGRVDRLLDNRSARDSEEATRRPTRVIKCWNCESEGHYSIDCPKPKNRKFCYRCGQAEVTVRSCPRCNRKQGNGQERL